MKSALRINIIFFFFCNVLSLTAQQNKIDTISEDELDNPDEIIFLKVSYLTPNPIQNNFASEALGFNYGYNFDINYKFPFQLLIGYKYQFMRAEPTEISLIGNYGRTNINTHGLNIGYKIDLAKRIDFEPFVTLAFTNYNNKKFFSSNYQNRINFRDTAYTLIFSSSVIYRISKLLSIFLQPDYRLDYTNIKTATEIQEFFSKAQYFNIQVGLRFAFD